MDMIGNLLTAGCLFSLNMIILVLAGLLRLLPSFLKFMRQMVGAALSLSIRFYNLLLAQAAPSLGQHLGIDILKGLGRIVATTLLSLTIGLIFILLVHLPFNWLTLGVCLVHGLVVGLAWDGISSAANLNLGDHLE
jgi:hypothetical protein